ncbi:MAG TPA: DUF4097 family beta strand repeat-containing protein [Candidatus Hydrogenedentes bacterium]|nr:DUF4097 family beta strand repeat-containing protein [Candidatus Hydrogenedentota bacterium]
MVRKSVITAALIAVAIQIFCVGILAPNLPREVCRPGLLETRQFNLPATPALNIIGKNGAVRVSVGDGDVFTVTAEIRAYTRYASDAPTASEYLSRLFQVDCQGEVTRLTVEPEEAPDTVDVRVDLQVAVPEGTGVAVDVINGNIWVEGAAGDVAVEGNNSDVQVQGARGAVTVKTTNGRIMVHGARAETTLETANGGINVQMLGGALQASTITGNITLRILSDEVDACDLTSLNGSITLLLKESCSAELSASTVRGTVDLDPALVVRGGEIRRRAVRGMLGNGRTKLSLNSMNGNIVLQRSQT